MFENSLTRRGFMFILSSPSGAGKTTLSRLLMQNDDNLVMSTSYTTRSKREQELDGVDYFFVPKEEFDHKVKHDYFFEHAEVFGNFYGTPREFVVNAIETGKDVLFDIDWQGTRRLTSSAREDTVSVFILPPSMNELERRLHSRGQDNAQTIARRMERANDEISHWNEYDYVIVNDNIDASLQKILYILKAERLKRTRQHGLNSFVENLLNKK